MPICNPSASAAQAFAPTHLRVVSANSVSPATFFSSSSTAQPSARKKTPANSRATTPNPIGTRSSPRKRKGGSVSQSASEASEAEENAEVDDSGQVSPRRLRSRATPESKNSSAKRPRINIEQSDSEPDTSAPASATSSKPAISLEPPVEEATESRSNGSTSPEVVTTRARTKRVSAEKPAAKKTTRGKYGQFKALPKSKKGKGKKKATVSSDDEHNSEEDGQGTRASSASSVQQSLGLKVPAVRALAKSRAGGSRNVSRETSRMWQGQFASFVADCSRFIQLLRRSAVGLQEKGNEQRTKSLGQGMSASCSHWNLLIPFAEL